MYSQTKRQQQIAPFLVNPQQNILEKSHTTHSNCKNLIVFFLNIRQLYYINSTSMQKKTQKNIENRTK